MCAGNLPKAFICKIQFIMWLKGEYIYKYLMLEINFSVHFIQSILQSSKRDVSDY